MAPTKKQIRELVSLIGEQGLKVKKSRKGYKIGFDVPEGTEIETAEDLTKQETYLWLNGFYWGQCVSDLKGEKSNE